MLLAGAADLSIQSSSRSFAEGGLHLLLQVGNFRVEPPGLFRGRGEHPKMGKVKTRIFPRDIVINIGWSWLQPMSCSLQ